MVGDVSADEEEGYVHEARHDRVQRVSKMLIFTQQAKRETMLYVYSLIIKIGVEI